MAANQYAARRLIASCGRNCALRRELARGEAPHLAARRARRLNIGAPSPHRAQNENSNAIALQLGAMRLKAWRA